MGESVQISSHTSDWRQTTHNCRVMGSVWVLFLFLPIQDPYTLHCLQAAHLQPVSRIQLECTLIELYMGSVMGIICVLWFRLHPSL